MSRTANASARTKARAANLAVPQSKDEASRFLAEIGRLSREVARVEADMNDRIAAEKEAGEAAAAGAVAAREALTEGLRTWCEANRAVLTEGGKRKFAELGTGRVEWRFAPPRVTVRGVEAAIAAIRSLGLPFLRVKEEINKEAMLGDPERAKLVPGVSVGSAGEDFILSPFEATIEGATP